MAPSTRGNHVWQIENGDDFIQGYGLGGAIRFWIDANGVYHPASGGSFIQPTENIYVDANSSTTMESGSIINPFKTIMGAVNFIASQGQTVDVNGICMNPYTIYVAAGVYQETIDLSNTALRYLTFVGYGALIGAPGGGGFVMVQAINNDNLTDVNFIGFEFYPGTFPGNHAYNFSSTTNGTNFGSGINNVGITFTDCYLRGAGTGPAGDFYVNNCGSLTLERCVCTATLNITNCVLAIVKGGINALTQGSQFNVFTTGGPSPAGFSSTQGQVQNASCLATVSLDAGSSFIAFMGARMRSAITVNGAFTNRSSSISGAITVNSGGTYKEDTGGGHSGALTVNSGGTYSQTGTYGIGTLFLNGNQISTGTGSPNNVVTGNPGDMYLNKSGGSATTLWVKESGTGTNTGWVGK